MRAANTHLLLLTCMVLLVWATTVFEIVQRIKEGTDTPVEHELPRVKVSHPHDESSPGTLLERIKASIHDPDAFVFMPDMKDSIQRIADVEWDGTATGWGATVAHWRQSGRERAVLVELRVRTNWGKAVADNLDLLPLDVRVVLVGHYSQNYGSLSEVQKDLMPAIRTALEDPRLVFWFVNQRPFLRHPKLLALPLGVNAWPVKDFVRQIWSYAADANSAGGVPVETSVLHLPRDGGPKPTRTQLREHAEELIRSGSTAHYVLPNNVSDCAGVQANKCWRPYIRAALHTRMALSPPGLGFDCHRTYELLAAGVVPIVQHSPMDRTFARMPVLLVDDLSGALDDVRGLRSKYDALLRGGLDLKRLSTGYWKELILSTLPLGGTEDAAERVEKLHPNVPSNSSR